MSHPPDPPRRSEGAGSFDAPASDRWAAAGTAAEPPATAPTTPDSDGLRSPRAQPVQDWRDRAGARQAIDTGAVVWGVILIAVGTWFLLDQTLGIDMPDVAWGDLWPVLLLVIGGAVILQGLRRRPS